MHQELLAKIEAYRHKWLLEETTVGIALAGDPWLIRDLRGKRKFRLKTLDNIEKKLRKKPQLPNKNGRKS